MELVTDPRTSATGIWDEERVKALLHFPRSPIRLIQQEPWQSWIGQRGGPKAVTHYLQNYPFSPSHQRILDVVLSTPEAVADVYADRLNISRATYFYRLRELVAAIIQALNYWELEPVNAPTSEPLFQSNVPAPLTGLVGAETVLQSLTRMLISDDVRLVTLLGPGGIGKTRLAVELARRQERTACFVDLSRLLDPAEVAPAIAQSLGLPGMNFPGPGEPGHPEAAVKKALRERQCLLVLDNFEHLLPARSLVTGLLAACPYLKIIVTSRAALHVSGEHEYLVPPLAAAESETVKNQQLWAQSPAVALFVQRAQAVSPGFSLHSENVEAVNEICQRLEGLPLAIEMAAFQVKYFSPRAILSRIASNRLEFLSQGTRWASAHQQSLRLVLDWSFGLLSPELRQLFCAVAAFPGRFNPAEAGAACAVENVQAGLMALVDQSLLEQQMDAEGEPCFQMPGITREYALEKVREGSMLLDKKPVSADNLLNVQPRSSL